MSLSNRHKQIKSEIMKKVFLSFILFATVSLAMYSSPQRGNHKRGDRSAMMKELNLSSEQQDKISTVNKDFKVKIDAVKENSSLTGDVKRDRINELSKQKKEQILSVLTPEQQTKWKESREKRKDNSKTKSGRFDRKDNNRMKDLNLTEDQKTKMQALKKDFRSKMQVLRDDNSQSKEDKAKKRKELADAHKSQIESILTPEQQAKLKEFGKDRMNHKHNKEFSGRKGGKGGKMKPDAETTAKLDVLKQDFLKQKQSIELSRIAPDAQKEKIQELKEKYRADKNKIIKDARQRKGNNKTS